MKYVTRFATAALLWWGLTGFPDTASALQTVSGHDPAPMKMSNRDLNRISLPDPIVKVYTGKSIDVKIEGREAYVSFPPSVTGPVELYLVTGEGTYDLVLVPLPIPAQSVVVTDGGGPRAGEEPESYVRSIKMLLRTVAGGGIPPGYEVSPMIEGKEYCPIEECSLVPIRRYTGRRMVVTEYRLSNPTDQTRTYDEPLFARQGIRAIAIERHELDPGNSTRVFLVEEGKP